MPSIEASLVEPNAIKVSAQAIIMPRSCAGATAETPMQWQARIEQLLYDEQLAATLALYGAHDATAAGLQPACHLGLPPQAAEASAPPIWASHDAAQRSQGEADARLAAQLAGHAGGWHLRV